MNQSAFSLNPSQQKAVDHPGGPLLVVAGPGTGKTRTLTCRIADLVDRRGVLPGSILALTFTNRAAGEMRARLDALLGDPLRSPAGPDPSSEVGRTGTSGGLRRMFIGTFHALGLLLVRENRELLGFEREPALLDEEDRQTLIREILSETGAGAGPENVDRVLKLLKARAGESAPGEGADRPRDEALALDGAACSKAADLYEAAKQGEGAVDFDDLIRFPLGLLRRHPDVLGRCRERWRHIFVDEYQDVNAPQVALVKLLASAAVSFTTIGDPDQAIYSFRGADPAHFHRFSEDFPGAEVLRLHDNYRSTATILSASDQIIRGRDEGAADKPVRTRGGRGLLLEVRSFATDRAEATFIGRRIESMAGGIGRFGLEEIDCPLPDADEDDEKGFGDIAVLYRLNAQARAICDSLDRAGIPFQRVGTGRRGRDPASRAVLALARLAVRSEDGAARRTLKALELSASGITAALSRTRQEGDSPAGLLERAGRSLAEALPGRAEELRRAAAELALRSGDGAGEAFDFITAAPLVVSEDPFAARSEKVTLSTLHAAKGLEFPVVFIIGMEDGLVPYLREEPDLKAGGEEPDEGIDEERRLLYVGMTRARERLLLTSARRRFLFGRTKERARSPFLEKISTDLVRFVRERSAGKPRGGKTQNDGQMNLF